MVSGPVSKGLRVPVARSIRYPARSASAVFPAAVAAETPANAPADIPRGANWSALAARAPKKMPGHRPGPSLSTAAMASPAGIQTAVALVPGTASLSPSVARAK
jgi:hypothetical protein